MTSPMPNARTAFVIAVIANAKKRDAINALRVPPDFVLHMGAGDDAPFPDVIKEHVTNTFAQREWSWISSFELVSYCIVCPKTRQSVIIRFDVLDTVAESDANSTDAINLPSADRVTAPVTAEGVDARWKDATNPLSRQPIFVSSMEGVRNAITRVAKRLLEEELFIVLL